jgi:hypothetical protein
MPPSLGLPSHSSLNQLHEKKDTSVQASDVSATRLRLPPFQLRHISCPPVPADNSDK